MSIDIAVRATLIFGSALLATLVLRRSAAATRHLLLAVAFTSVLALPLLMQAIPAWRVLPVVERVEQPSHGGMPAASIAAPQGVAAAGVSHSFAETRLLTAAANNLGTIAFITWGVVTFGLLLRIATGIAAVRRLARNAPPAPRAARAILDELVVAGGVTRPIRLLVSDDVAMPMAWGSRGGLILLPREVERWSEERTRLVLLHELAHVLRADSLTNAVARLAVACHWFNPLAWIALRAMIGERERACDDHVVASGAVAADYAQHLLDIARSDLSGATWSMAPAMARRSELEGRLLAILTPHRTREHRAVAFAVSFTLIVTAAFVSAASPERVASPSPQPRPAPAQAPTTALRPSVVTEAMRDDEQAEGRTDRGVRSALVESLGDPRDDVRENAALGLAMRSEPDVVPALIEALKDPSSQVREKAALGLAFRRGPQIVDALLTAARDEDSQVREKAVFGLALSGDARALPALKAAAKDSDAQVREKAVQGLAMFSTGDTPASVNPGTLRDIVRGVAGAMSLFADR